MKIKGILTFVFCLCVGFVFGQWTSNLDSTFPSLRFFKDGVLKMSLTASPSLDVFGTVRISKSIAHIQDQKSFTMGHGGRNGFISIASGNLDFRLGTITAVTVASSGNVGIGTSTPASPLSVNGKIESKEVQVKATIADYVFKDDYKLLNLDELATYIDANGHLPNVQSEKDVEANRGFVEIGSLSISLLEKVEELTLHLIDINNRLKSLEKENEILKEQINNAN